MNESNKTKVSKYLKRRLETMKFVTKNYYLENIRYTNKRKVAKYPKPRLVARKNVKTNINPMNRRTFNMTVSKKIKILDLKQIDRDVFYNSSIFTFMKKDYTFYIYNPNDMISNTILKYRTWEPQWVHQIQSYLLENPDIFFLDIGCNLGVFTLVAAILKRQVYSIDANIENLYRLRKTLIENNLTRNVILINNAITNSYDLYSQNPQPTNIGGQPVNKNNNGTIQSIYMDDLLNLIKKNSPTQKLNRFMIKIDIEGSEIAAFDKSHLLMDTIDVTVILMEWEGVKRYPTVIELMRNLYNRNYRPYNRIINGLQLNPHRFLSWPFDVVWKKVY